MKCTAVILTCLLSALHVFGQSQLVEYDANHVGGNTVYFTIRLRPLDDPVTAIAISNTATGLISTGTSANACGYTTVTSPVALTLEPDAFNGDFWLLELRIDYSDPNSVRFETIAGEDLGCYFTVTDINSGSFKFHIRGLATLGGEAATDREFEIDSIGTNLVSAFEFGSLTFLGSGSSSLATAATVTTYTIGMTVVDSPDHNDKTNMDLGETAQLKFTMTVNPHETNMDLSGARLTNCVVSKVPNFQAPFVTFIGSDGCFGDVDIYKNVHTDVGFSRDASSVKTGSTKTYIAYSPRFEMAAFTRNPVIAPNALYFRCDVTFCLDDTDSANDGQCGASHCDTGGRRKRDSHDRPDTSVIASVNITNGNTRKTCSKCTDTTTFKAAVGGLATAVAIVFGVMTLSFTSAKSSAISRKQRRTKEGPRTPSSVSSRSVKGSDVTSSCGGIPRKY